jgi:epoxyqueuosine reductase
MTAEELRRTALELGIDEVGATPAVAYESTERDILERRARGLFGRMRFTMARPEVSCHPERLLPNARTVVAAALCYWSTGLEAPTDAGVLPRHAWRDNYGILRERLDALGQRLGGAYRVLVDENDHVDREAAVRAGVGFYGKNTMVITRGHGSWVVLGTLVTDIEIESSARLRAGCGSCTACIDACPTHALDEPGVLDATRCLSYWTQTAEPMPEDVMDALGGRVYGCDICQDVCPWNRGIENRRGSDGSPSDTEPFVDLASWLDGGSELALRRPRERLFVPRNETRWLRRNALVALGNVGAAADGALLGPYLEGEDDILAAVAARALERFEQRETMPA